MSLTCDGRSHAVAQPIGGTRTTCVGNPDIGNAWLKQESGELCLDIPDGRCGTVEWKDGSGNVTGSVFVVGPSEQCLPVPSGAKSYDLRTVSGEDDDGRKPKTDSVQAGSGAGMGGEAGASPNTPALAPEVAILMCESTQLDDDRHGFTYAYTLESMNMEKNLDIVANSVS